MTKCFWEIGQNRLQLAPSDRGRNAQVERLPRRFAAGKSYMFLKVEVCDGEKDPCTGFTRQDFVAREASFALVGGGCGGVAGAVRAGFGV